MRNVLALLGAGLLAGCCLMHFHVPITEQTQANARTFGSLGQRLLPEDTPPERIAAFRQCLSEAYMEHYGEGEAGTAPEREDGYALFWQTVMAAAPTYDHLATYDIHVRGRKRYEADPRSFVEAGRAWSRIVFERCGAGVLENPFVRVVEEVAVMGHGDDGTGEAVQELLEPFDGFGVEMVRRFVEQQHVGTREQQAAERDAALFTTGEVADHGIPRRKAQGVGGGPPA